MRILLAEDERELVSALTAILRHNHYSVDAVFNGEDALDYGLTGQYDCIVLDIMMPRRDGISVLEELRRQGVSTPVLILTAKSQPEDRVGGLDAGANDYLTKPFVTGELLARIRALTRRTGELVPRVLSMGKLSLDLYTFELKGERESLRLGNKEFQLMELLMRNRGRFLSTETLMETIWGYDSEAEQGVVWVYISNLRRKLKALDAGVEITTARGRGYALEEKTDG